WRRPAAGKEPAERVARDDPHTSLIFQDASWPARLLAAATARGISRDNPFGLIRTLSAASVVPPGLVTSRRRSDGGRLSVASSAPAPMIVARASFSASMRGMPYASAA